MLVMVTKGAYFNGARIFEKGETFEFTGKKMPNNLEAVEVEKGEKKKAKKGADGGADAGAPANAEKTDKNRESERPADDDVL